MTRRSVLVIFAVSAIAAIIAGSLLWFRSPRVLANFTVTASSSAPGHSAANLSASQSPSAGWRSRGETVGAWVDLAWSEQQLLRSLAIELPEAGSPVTDGVLQFDDGSALQVALNRAGGTTTVDFTAREVRRVRFSIVAVSSGPDFVAIAGVRVNTSTVEVGSGIPGDAATDADIVANNGEATTALTNGQPWTVSPAGSNTLTYRWDEPRELVAVELAGAPEGAAITRALLRFDGGGQIEIGAVGTNPDLSTKVAFMPRVVRSLTLTIEERSGVGPLTLSAVRFWERGSSPLPLARIEGGTAVTAAPAEVCDDSVRGVPSRVIQVLCPTNGAAVESRAELVVAVPDGATGLRVDVWPASGDVNIAAGDAVGTGTVRIPLDLRALPAGPVTVHLTALGSPPAEAVPVEFQLLHGEARVERTATSSAARGRTLVYGEEFSAPVSTTRDASGGRYGAAKPEPGGYSDFGEAYFAGAGERYGNIGTLQQQYLRLGVSPVPTGWADPNGYDREHIGGMLASAHPGGAGFSAQYGYFEARMLVPANPGTWPAFWLLPSTNLIQEVEPVAEIDAVELYGHDPVSTCHTTHSYAGGADSGGVARCGRRFDSARQAAQWHTYGVAVDPTEIRYFIDGVQVETAPQVAGGGDPMFFLVNLALGGGWPVQLSGTKQRDQMLVDWVRVYA